ncbi:MAG: hypothetical protein K6E59_04585 [Bacilli bacterium]|nr:hypothetical protein [Bacilli bacterium]
MPTNEQENMEVSSTPEAEVAPADVSAPEQGTVEGKSKIDKEAQKSRKRKVRRKTWYNSPFFIAGVITFIVALAFFLMLFLDSDNSVRPAWMDSPWLRDFFKLFGIEPLNVYMTSWFLLIGITLIGYPLAMCTLLYGPIKNRRIIARTKKGKPVDKSWSTPFTIKWWILFISVMLVAVSVTAILFPWKRMFEQWSDPALSDAPVMINLLFSLLVMLAFIAIWPIAILLVVLLIRLLIWLIASVGQGVAKTMMSTGDYQDFKAAAEAAAAERRRDAGLSLPGDYALLGQDALSRVDFSNLQVNVDPNKIQGMNQLVGGQRKRDEERSGDLFPALTVIDKKWDDIWAEEERKKQEEENRKLHEEEVAKVLKEYQEACATALRDGAPEPEKPQILIDDENRIAEEKRLAEEEANRLAQAETEEAQDEKKKSAVIGTAVQNALDEDDRKRFEEAKKNHVPMTYKDFKTLAFRFQSYLCHQKYYFPIDTVRAWIAGFSSSRLIILQGLSGTGKSTLPRVFLEYIGGKAFFFPVQATWRDRSDIVGYYSDFTGEFKETELLKHLYEASYFPDQMNIMVLDEMNISRIEYYFADFLSIFEYPPEDWLIPLMQVKLGTPTPRYIENGKVRIPTNTWFIGTANTDDSTFTITDKVYDRAIVIEFKDLNLPFTSDWDYSPYPLTMEELTTCINEAMTRKENALTDAERTKFLKLTMFIGETFDLAFGNRIMNQIDRFVPVFVALGGTKEAALDLMLSRKILRKLDGHFESFVKNGLVKLVRYLQQNYGKGTFKESEALIEKYNRKLS